MAGIRTLIVIASLVALLPGAEAQEKNFSVAIKGSLTTGSQIFPHPNSRDEFERAEFSPVKDILGYGLEVRYRFPESDLAIALSADYLRKVNTTSRKVSNIVVPEEDGYRVLPVELTGYFLIPISGEKIGVYMGGGVGTYFGRRIYRFANVEAKTTDAGNGFGIHVLSGLSWRFNHFFSINAEMKFRDLQFHSTNQFDSKQIVYGRSLLNVPQVGESRIHTDGMIFQIGAVLDFSGF
jgi:hypothetical protein